MNLIKNIFGQERNITPEQFYFPYFFDEFRFRKLISPYNLTTELEFDKKTQMASCMHLNKDGITKLTVKFGQQLMIDEGNLILWFTDENKLAIYTYPLDFNSGPKDLEIDILKLEFGINKIENKLSLTNFITYVRSEKIKYVLEYYETFGIIIINNEYVELIPFDWFNEKGGDYGYVWPALAQTDKKATVLVGIGMRIGDFKIELRKKAYNNV